ncbi:hypothetical protein PIIN_04819 [Serendipita indica DSM 11827]|uniref:Uncharacterized protein n=1 Tax=Serendipita indica (strain DSM 11827) TaxID=1109443 RepID=G4THV2_SERID|nr:hypothetical protein PIIN_04819 [Serendipita indica DSM 11827]
MNHDILSLISLFPFLLLSLPPRSRHTRGCSLNYSLFRGLTNPRRANFDDLVQESVKSAGLLPHGRMLEVPARCSLANGHLSSMLWTCVGSFPAISRLNDGPTFAQGQWVRLLGGESALIEPAFVCEKGYNLF